MRARRGANAIEFALTLPVFMGIVLGLIDYGWVFATQAGIDSAASLACREGAMIDPLLGSPKTTAQNQLSQRAARWCANSKGCNFTVEDAGRPVPERTLRCVVELDVAPLVGFVPTPPRLTSVAWYRLEWQNGAPL